jgi:hypothetical protein
VATLFQGGYLGDFLQTLVQRAVRRVEELPEDDLLTRSEEDIVADLLPWVWVDPLSVAEDPTDGSVTEVILQGGIDLPPDPLGRRVNVRAYRVEAVYPYSGDGRLFDYQPSQHLVVAVEASVTADDVRVAITQSQGGDVDPERVKQGLNEQVSRIRRMAGYASNDVAGHNARIEAALRQAVETRRAQVLQRRGLAGALGFPLTKRADSPRPVPLERKQVSLREPGRVRQYQDEPALTDAEYEEAIEVVRSTLLAMERSPSVASSKTEEDLRDQILVQLNGTFRGAATGETFLQSGKTDILLRVDNRHVFVAECKWWDGPAACSKALDQLLSYLPWRDEKAALILFISRKNATAAIEAADTSIRGHGAFKRLGSPTAEPQSRRNYMVAQPEDLDREIKLAALFAVLPRETPSRAARLGTRRPALPLREGQP